MIIHTVAFTLKKEISRQDKIDFFNSAMQLANISGVLAFRCLNQVSIKNPFKYYLTMEFENEQLYKEYSNHPLHIRFINEQWLVYVDIFQEGDYTAFSMEEL